MKHFILSVIILCAGFVQQAKGETYNVETPGSLSALVGENQKYLENVIITGVLNYSDYLCISGMSNLKTLDLKDVSFKYDDGEDYLEGSTIFGRMFNDNDFLQTVILPADIVTIAEEAFYLSSVDEVILGDKVEVIGANAFERSELRKISLPASMKSIGNSAFKGCPLNEITVPESVTYLGETAFNNCFSLTKVNIEAQLTDLPSGIFDYCRKLVNVQLPSSLKSIGASAFRDCESLIELSLPSSVTSYDNYAFANCGFTSFKISDQVTSIGINAFWGCKQLANINIPVSLTVLPDGVFEGCGFTSFTIPNHVTSVGESAFSGNRVLESIVFSEGMTEIPKGVCEDCPKLKNLIIPKSIKKIGERAFLETGLSSITIPANVEIVENYAFPFTLTSVFWNTTCTIRENCFGIPQWRSMLDGVSANALFYLTTDAQVFDGCNVIRNGVAENITLVRDFRKNESLFEPSIYFQDFHCPQAFKAKKISYTRNFFRRSGHGTSEGWQTISLPFTVTSIVHEAKGECSPFGCEDGKLHFWLKQLTENGFEQATVIEANKPYLICIPNNEAYDEEYILTGDITFSAESSDGITVPATSETSMSSEGRLYTMYSNYDMKEMNGNLYAVNRVPIRLQEVDGQLFPEASVFYSYARLYYSSEYSPNPEEGLAYWILPFEAYLVTKESPANAPMYYSIGGGDGGDITGLEDILLKENKSLNIYAVDNTLYIQTDRDRDIHIYDITGRTVRQVEAKEGMNTVTGLAKGFYFLEGKKVLIK